MNTYDIVKYWDDYLVEQHVGSELAVIIDYLKKQNKTNITYIDIGANCGKYYDVLSRYFTIDNCVMVEASIPLYDYLNIKFQNKQCVIYNKILSDTDDMVNFADIDFSYIKELGQNINLGLSKAYGCSNGSREQLSAGNFLTSYVLDAGINNIDLIKIDTENRDYHILKAMTPYISKFNNKPLICFEHNYHNDMSKDEAQNILNNFCNNNNYNSINIDDIKWSSVFLCP
jgi:FkbM family methyltransferase